MKKLAALPRQEHPYPLVPFRPYTCKEKESFFFLLNYRSYLLAYCHENDSGFEPLPGPDSPPRLFSKQPLPPFSHVRAVRCVGRWLCELTVNVWTILFLPSSVYTSSLMSLLL